MPIRAVKHAFEAEIIGGKLDFPKEELLDAKFFSFEEIKNMKSVLREEWVFDAIEIIETKK